MVRPELRPQDAGGVFGGEAARRLAGREHELFPRLVRQRVLAVLWVALVLVFGALAVVVALLGELR